MSDTLPFLITAFFFGLNAGTAPGPLLTVVISETIKHNKIAGIKVAIAPLITDAPIILLCAFILSKISGFHTILGVISILGGLFFLHIAYESIKTKGVELDLQNVKAQSLRRGIIANGLNPSPYIFWLTIGTPLILKAYQVSFATAAGFLIIFFGLLVGCKIIIAMIVDKSRGFLKKKGYIWTMRMMGVIMLIYAVIFIKDGINFFMS